MLNKQHFLRAVCFSRKSRLIRALKFPFKAALTAFRGVYFQMKWSVIYSRCPRENIIIGDRNRLVNWGKLFELYMQSIFVLLNNRINNNTFFIIHL